MLDALLDLSMFSAKAVILVILFLLLIAGILALLGRGKGKPTGKIQIKNLNQKLNETAFELSQTIYPKKKFKQFLKDQKKANKERYSKENIPNLFVIKFNGDIKASAVTALREEITAVLGIAKPKDEVVVCVESGGGMVHSYGLAAAQLQRLKQNKIFLTVCIDKIAASGGYMMASVADKILAAPFAIVGSIGVIVQMPNFHRLLKENHIDFEQLTAGSFKRTLTLFGHNTEETREKLRQEIEEIHQLFKNLILENRPQLEIDKVSTGEHWLAKQAIDLKLVDELSTSDDFILKKSKNTNIYQLDYRMRKSLSEKIFAGAYAFKTSLKELFQTW